MNSLAIAATTMLDTETCQLNISLGGELDTVGHAEPDGFYKADMQLCGHLPERYRQPAACTSERVVLAPWQERKAKEIIERSLYSRLFIADVARQCAMSRSHFSRVFKKTTGMSPKEWALDLRIRRAKEFLVSGLMPLSQISQECGFADQSHFSRMFSKLVGATPRRWQRLNSSVAQSA